jgi:hypothetical protein
MESASEFKPRGDPLNNRQSPNNPDRLYVRNARRQRFVDSSASGHQEIRNLLHVARSNIDLALSKINVLQEGDASEKGREEYLTVRELCARIPLAEQTIRNKMSRGELREHVHFHRCGRRVTFVWSAMELWLTQGGTLEETVEPFIPETNGRTRKAQ